MTVHCLQILRNRQVLFLLYNLIAGGNPPKKQAAA
jgi:hypothetical protein